MKRREKRKSTLSIAGAGEGTRTQASKAEKKSRAMPTSEKRLIRMLAMRKRKTRWQKGESCRDAIQNDERSPSSQGKRTGKSDLRGQEKGARYQRFVSKKETFP